MSIDTDRCRFTWSEEDKPPRPTVDFATGIQLLAATVKG